MIRPLAYCETSLHIERSLATIDSRIEELRTIRELYVARYNELQTLHETAKNKEIAQIQNSVTADF